MKKSLAPCENAALIDGKKMNDPLPDSDHVLRYCSPRHVNEGIIHGSAFRIRPGEEYLSVNWMEYFGKSASVEEQTDGIRTALIKKKFQLKSDGRFARLHVGTVKEVIQNAEVKRVPGPKDPSHAGIYPGRQDNREATLELRELTNIIKSEDVFLALKDE